MKLQFIVEVGVDFDETPFEMGEIIEEAIRDSGYDAKVMWLSGPGGNDNGSA